MCIALKSVEDKSNEIPAVQQLIDMLELMGAVVTFALIFIYSAGNLGVFLFYSRERKKEFHWVLHTAFPFLGTVALVFVGYSSLVPWPAPPVAYAPWMVGIWLVLGIVVLVVMNLTGRERWMPKAGSVAQERSDPSSY